jgi:CubicO group peptidase (beta-lactamase class C family)
LERAQLERLHRESGLPGLCVATVDSSGVQATAAFGWADIATKVPYTDETVQPIGSISKTTIGLLLATLASEGSLDLDAPIGTPAGLNVRHPRHSSTAITWRQLATHTSSIIDERKVYASAYEPRLQAQTSMPAFVAHYFKGSPKEVRRRYGVAAPGTAFVYSNMGAALAAVALEPKLGADFEQATAQRIFTPLGMSATRWRYDPALGTRNATLYQLRKGENVPLPNYSLATYADGGLRTSCSDLARYADAILRAHAGKASPLSGDAVRLMLTPQWRAEALPKGVPQNEPNQGLFWQFRRNGGVGHSGGDPGLSAFLALDLATQRARIFLTNGDLEERPAARQAFAAIWQSLLE